MQLALQALTSPVRRYPNIVTVHVIVWENGVRWGDGAAAAGAGRGMMTP
jgi:hypothetical protein